MTQVQTVLQSRCTRSAGKKQQQHRTYWEGRRRSAPGEQSETGPKRKGRIQATGKLQLSSDPNEVGERFWQWGGRWTQSRWSTPGWEATTGSLKRNFKIKQGVNHKIWWGQVKRHLNPWLFKKCFQSNLSYRGYWSTWVIQFKMVFFLFVCLFPGHSFWQCCWMFQIYFSFDGATMTCPT